MNGNSRRVTNHDLVHDLGPPHRKTAFAGMAYGWDAEPTANPDLWGMRCVVPCRQSDGTYATHFGLIGVTEAVVRRYTDFWSRYDATAAIAETFTVTGRWYRVRLVDKPFSGMIGEVDPFTQLVRVSLNRMAQHGLKPLVREEDLLDLHWKAEVMH